MKEGINYQTTNFSKMSEKLCLQWNDFNENITSVFRSLREDKNFADVTLACKDGRQIEAPKVILVASSPLFKKFLMGNKHIHPMIYLRGWRSADILAIIDFLYYGEANVYARMPMNQHKMNSQKKRKLHLTKKIPHFLSVFKNTEQLLNIKQLRWLVTFSVI